MACVCLYACTHILLHACTCASSSESGLPPSAWRPPAPTFRLFNLGRTCTVMDHGQGHGIFPFEALEPAVHPGYVSVLCVPSPCLCVYASVRLMSCHPARTSMPASESSVLAPFSRPRFLLERTSFSPFCGQAPIAFAAAESNADS
jgi:hypothetical protein